MRSIGATIVFVRTEARQPARKLLIGDVFGCAGDGGGSAIVGGAEGRSGEEGRSGRGGGSEVLEGIRGGR